MAKEEKKELSFEESLLHLEEIVKKLETGEVPLDDAITEFNKAMVLAKNDRNALTISVAACYL